MVDDSPIAAYFAHAIGGLQVTRTLPGTESTYAIFVRRGDTTLHETLNAGIASLEADGTLKIL